jgi:hypothetical protein
MKLAGWIGIMGGEELLMGMGNSQHHDTISGRGTEADTTVATQNPRSKFYLRPYVWLLWGTTAGMYSLHFPLAFIAKLASRFRDYRRDLGQSVADIHVQLPCTPWAAGSLARTPGSRTKRPLA